MKKNLFFIMLLSVVCMTVSAEDYKTYQDAAKASHKVLKEKIEEQKDPVKDNKVKKIIGNTNTKTKKYTYVIVQNNLQKADTTYNKRGISTKVVQKWALEGNLKIVDTKANNTTKYESVGYVEVREDSVIIKSKTSSASKKAPKTYTRVYNIATKNVKLDPTKLVKVPYFESEAKNKAKESVEGFYKQHKEFVEVNIGKVEPCEKGYKITTTRTFYKDAQKYTGDKGTVIFTVQKGETLEDFKLLLELNEEHLIPFDNTPAPKEDQAEEATKDKEVMTDNRSNQEKVEQVVVNSFQLNSIVLSEDNKEQLDQAAQILLLDKELEIELLGHSCDLGSEETNYTFGIMRAKEAKKYLVDKGVEPKRIYVHSYGAKKPLVPNTTAENRAQNRRVEIKVIK